MKNILLFIAVAAIILATGCSKDEPEPLKNAEITMELLSEISTDSLMSYTGWMQNMGTRFALASNRRIVAVNIREKFKSFGYDNARLDSFYITKTYKGTEYRQWQYNVIASLETTGESDSICIIGGHYDNITSSGDPFTSATGANDNASGIAATLEVARVMKLKNFEPENTIRFIAFGAEELGLYGSKAYASGAKNSLEKIILMLNNDMIAYEPESSMWSVNIMDYDNSRLERNLAYMLCREYTVMSPYNNNTYSSASDSYPFFTNGYKALFFFSRKMDPTYHTLSDIVANCNFEYCAEIVKLNCAILAYKN